MPFPWAAALPIAGSALAAGASIFGASRANRGQRRQARIARTFSAAEAGKSRAFSERMRSTAWQAGIADMEAAGVNPALAYSQGPASSPSGAMANTAQAQQQDAVSGAVSSALQYKRLDAEINSIKAGVKKTEAETEAIRGRPGRILEPAVTRGARSMEDFFGDRTMRIMNYESGNSARTIRRETERLMRILKFEAKRIFNPRRPTIGPNTTRRR